MWWRLKHWSDRTLTRVISDVKKLYGLLATPGIEVMNLVLATPDDVWISSKYRGEEDVPILRHTNELIGAYVTAGASIHLYRYVHWLQESAIYCDMVSVIYIQQTDSTELIETV